MDGFEEPTGFKDKIFRKTEKFSSWMLEAGDKLGTYVMWDAALIDYINKNFGKNTELTEEQKREAVRYADDIARRASAGRGIGEVPLKQKSILVNFFAAFQVEVNNAFTVFWRNAISANGKRNIRGLTAYLISSAILNGIVREIFGWGVTYDPIGAIKDTIEYCVDNDDDDEKTLFDKLKYAFQRNVGEAVENLPYASVIFSLIVNSEISKSLFGDSDPSRYGTGQFAVNMFLKPFMAMADKDDVLWPTFEAVINTALPFGGTQIQRMIKGFFDVGGTLPGTKGKPMFSLDKGFYSSETAGIPGKFSKKGNLLYSVNNDPWDMFMTILFGSSYSRKGKEYNDKENKKAYSEKQTTVYKTLVQSGLEPNKAEDVINGLAKAIKAEAYDPEGEKLTENEKVRLYLDRNTELTEAQKLDVYYLNLKENSKDKQAIDEALELGMTKEALWNFIFNAESIELDPDISEGKKEEQQLGALMATEAPEAAKASVFYNMLASEAQKQEYDGFIQVGCTDEEAFKLCSTTKGKNKSEKLDAVLDSDMSEEQKAGYYMNNMMTETEKNLMTTLESGGVSAKDRKGVSSALMYADRGKDNKLSNSEMASAIANADGISEAGKIAALGELIPNSFEDLKTVTDEGITVKQFTDAKNFFDGCHDKTVDGKKVKKQEQVADHINGMKLTPKQKTALWYALGYKSKNLEKYADWYDGEIYEDVGRADGSSINSEGGYTQKSSGKKKSGSKKKSSGTKKRYSKAPMNPLSGMPGQRSSSSVKVIKHTLPKAGQIGKITLPKV
jgi:hypothetical protein